MTYFHLRHRLGKATVHLKYGGPPIAAVRMDVTKEQVATALGDKPADMRQWERIALERLQAAGLTNHQPKESDHHAEA